MNPFLLTLTFGPLAAYLLALGAINRRSRPLVVGGVRDLAALCLALSGAIAAGPLNLFLPDEAVLHYRGYVWVLLAVFYVLAVTMLLLLARPRIVVFNIPLEQLRPILVEVAKAMDDQAAWSGDQLFLPAAGVQLHMEYFVPLRNVSLVSTGDNQSFAGWQRLERSLRSALGGVAVPNNPRAFSLVSMSLLIFLLLFMRAAQNPAAMATGLRELLQL